MKKESVLYKEFKDLLLSEEEQRLIFSGYEKIVIKKGELLLKKGAIVNNYYLVEKGFLRSFVLDIEGNQVTTNFYTEGNIVLEETSFFLRSATQENIEVLLSFREHCDFLVAVGACAINGGVPAMRNSFSPDQCLKEAYIDGMGIVDGQIPDDPELPTLLAKVLPIESQVKIDCHLPGCPPPPAAFLEVVNAFHHNRPVNLDYDLRHFD